MFCTVDAMLKLDYKIACRYLNAATCMHIRLILLQTECRVLLLISAQPTECSSKAASESACSSPIMRLMSQGSIGGHGQAGIGLLA